MEKLKPCPFDGKEAILKQDDKGVFVMCKYCHSRTRSVKDYLQDDIKLDAETVKKIWNNRV